MAELSEKQQDRRLEEIRKRREMRVSECFQLLMDEDWGRDAAYYIIFELCGVNGGGFDHKVKDGIAAALHHAVEEGSRSVGRNLMDRLQSEAPDNYILMLIEHFQKRRIDLSLANEQTRAAVGDIDG